MKLLLIISLSVLFAGCSLLQGARDALTGAYDAGKYAGREEIIRDLAKNKKKLAPFREMTIQELLDLSKEEVIVAPLSITILQLLLERNNLKRALANLADESTSLDSASSDK